MACFCANLSMDSPCLLLQHACAGIYPGAVLKKSAMYVIREKKTQNIAVFFLTIHYKLVTEWKSRQIFQEETFGIITYCPHNVRFGET